MKDMVRGWRLAAGGCGAAEAVPGDLPTAPPPPQPVMREGGRKRSTKGVYLALPLRKQQDITNSILSKWNDNQLRQPWLPNGNFTRFRDGNRKNWARSNAETVDIVESFKHLEVWDINWDVGLTAEEIAVVCDTEWHPGARR